MMKDKKNRRKVRTTYNGLNTFKYYRGEKEIDLEKPFRSAVNILERLRKRPNCDKCGLGLYRQTNGKWNCLKCAMDSK